MSAAVISVPIVDYPPEDQETWRKLCASQLALVQDVACQDFHKGFALLGLDFTRIPDPGIVSARLNKLTGWTLVSAQNKFLDAKEWFDHLVNRRFPVTDYIRRPHEVDFCELPDLFHEYFGHLSLFTHQHFADISEHFGRVSLQAQTERQQLDIARIWWFIFEVGFIREGSELKVIGGALLSSPGELQHACRPEVPKYPLTIERVTQTPAVSYSYHDHYFYLESIDQIHDILDEYARRESLLC